MSRPSRRLELLEPALGTGREGATCPRSIGLRWLHKAFASRALAVGQRRVVPRPNVGGRRPILIQLSGYAAPDDLDGLPQDDLMGPDLFSRGHPPFLDDDPKISEDIFQLGVGTPPFPRQFLDIHMPGAHVPPPEVICLVQRGLRSS